MPERLSTRRSGLIRLTALAGLCLGASNAALCEQAQGAAKPAAAVAVPQGATSSAPHAPAAAAPAAPAAVPSAASPAPSWFPGGDVLFVPPYYDSFKGLDLTGLTASQEEQFLHWVNTEFCTCAQTGCQRDTIANCYTNDPACPRAPVRIREILDKVKQGQPVPNEAPLPGMPAIPK